MENWIEEHDDINPEDIANCSELLINQYIKLQLDIVQKKRYTLKNLMKSIKTVKYGTVNDLKDNKLLGRGEQF